MTGTNPAFEGREWKYWTVPEVVDIQGVPTAYRRGGSGEPLVYLHGGGGTREWNPLHQELAKHFDVIAPEHPGFGDTPRGADQDTWEDYVLHYDAFFRSLDLHDFHLVGTSLGSWLAAHLAVYYPQRFKTLTLVTPLGVLVEGEPFVDLFELSPGEDAELMFNGRAERYAEDFGQEGEAADTAQQLSEASTAKLLIWDPPYERKFDTRLARVAVPSLVIGVDDDRLVGTGQAGRYAELLPNSTLVTIPGPNGEPSGHALPIEQPGDVALAIADHASKGV
ncbi:alpha/beta fold hydrolase [Streptomyces sp. NPDC057474]|uniref:alpha/beta fold hydrolase n=1 Tax=Streptomyces sp. NPDC057474 TaxID=3346144 RepID=UPI003690E695